MENPAWKKTPDELNANLKEKITREKNIWLKLSESGFTFLGYVGVLGLAYTPL